MHFTIEHIHLFAVHYGNLSPVKSIELEGTGEIGVIYIIIVPFIYKILEEEEGETKEDVKEGSDSL